MARSMRLPNAPPRISASPNRAIRSWKPSCVAYAAMATSAMAAMPIITTGLYGKSAAFSRPNAAPVLCTCVKSSSSRNDAAALSKRQQHPHDRLGDLIERDDDAPSFQAPADARIEPRRWRAVRPEPRVRAVRLAGSSYAFIRQRRRSCPEARRHNDRTDLPCPTRSRPTGRFASSAGTCCLRRGSTAMSTPEPSPSSGWSSSLRHDEERSARSSWYRLEQALRRRRAPCTITRAPSELPIVFAWRSASSARFTSSRMRSSRSHRRVRAGSRIASTS